MFWTTVTIVLLFLFLSANISIKDVGSNSLAPVSKFVCMLTGLRFVRKCIRGLKCRSFEAVHSPAHHACKPQGSALLSREREKHQPLTTALPSPSQIADSPCPSLISVFRAHSLILSVFFTFIIILFVIPFSSFFITLSHFLSLSHIQIQWYIFLFLSRADLFLFSFKSFILPCF